MINHACLQISNIACAHHSLLQWAPQPCPCAHHSFCSNEPHNHVHALTIPFAPMSPTTMSMRSPFLLLQWAPQPYVHATGPYPPTPAHAATLFCVHRTRSPLFILASLSQATGCQQRQKPLGASSVKSHRVPAASKATGCQQPHGTLIPRVYPHPQSQHALHAPTFVHVGVVAKGHLAPAVPAGTFMAV